MAAILKKWHASLIGPATIFFSFPFFPSFFFSLVTMNTYHGSRETPRYK